MWGGTRLIRDYGFTAPKDYAGEAWVFSCHPKGLSLVLNGRYAGKTLKEAIEAEGPAVLGTHNAAGVGILIKLIDAYKALSVQVHPDDAYARRERNENGKTEAWHIVEAAPGAELVYGLNREVSAEELARRADDGELEPILNTVPVKAGDTAFIPAGTIHAIGAGILLAEVQQSSDVTFRLYDYRRPEPDGTYRELNVPEAVAVANRMPTDAALEPKHPGVRCGDGIKTPLTACEFFSMTRVELNGRMYDTAGAESFVSLVVLTGDGEIRSDGQTLALKPGSSIFVPANTPYVLSGRMTLLETVT